MKGPTYLKCAGKGQKIAKTYISKRERLNVLRSTGGQALVSAQLLVHLGLKSSCPNLNLSTLKFSTVTAPSLANHVESLCTLSCQLASERHWSWKCPVHAHSISFNHKLHQVLDVLAPWNDFGGLRGANRRNSGVEPWNIVEQEWRNSPGASSTASNEVALPSVIKLLNVAQGFPDV